MEVKIRDDLFLGLGYGIMGGNKICASCNICPGLDGFNLITLPKALAKIEPGLFRNSCSSREWETTENPRQMSNHFVRKSEGFAPGLPDVMIPMRTAIPSPQLSIQGTAWDSQHLADAAQTNLPVFPGPQCGCHLFNFRPTGSRENYDGTLRVECHIGGYTISGDLYQRPLSFSKPSYTTQAPNPSHGIPIFAIQDYRYYLRAIQLSELPGQFKGFMLTFELYNYEKQAQSWQNEGIFTAQMNCIDAPIGYPSPTDYFEGEVRNTHGKVIGRLEMGWVSKYLRKATIEIDRVEDTGELLNNGNDVTWNSIFSQVGWDINVIHKGTSISAPNKQYWTDAELHDQMLICRGPVDLDIEWRYHLLVVRRLLSWDRGVMYDSGATDSNRIPREGAAIAAHWKIPDEPVWGEAAGQRLDRSKAAYFRTAVHEIGHAMGLEHNESDNGIMNATDVIARNRTPTTPFPRNIIWAFSAPEQKALRHYPDILVRPGGAVSSKR